MTEYRDINWKEDNAKTAILVGELKITGQAWFSLLHLIHILQKLDLMTAPEYWETLLTPINVDD